MYIPAAFAETDLSTLHAAMEKHSFGTLISQAEGVPVATHLPFLLDRKAGEFGQLLGHVARANPQGLESHGEQVLVIFSGPHAYVSPGWYQAESVVPTWNYVAVHVYGVLEVIEEEQELLAMMQQAVTHFESGLPQPWSLEGPASFVQRMLAQIVGFRIKIQRIEGKWKLSQNHPEERRRKVIEALQGQGDENSFAIAKLMQQSLAPGEK